MKTVIFSVIFVIFITGLLALNEDCTTNSDCSKDNAICSENKKCECSKYLTYQNENNVCMTYATEYKGHCEEDQQCSFLGEQSQCYKNSCVCKSSPEEKYRWYQGMCRKYVDKNDSCESDIDCYNGYDLRSLQCRFRKCSCNKGFYERHSDCRHLSNECNIICPTETCALDTDCAATLTSERVCSLGRCVRKEDEDKTFTISSAKYYWEQSQMSPRSSVLYQTESISSISCQSDSQCGDLKNSVCSDGVCSCLENYYLDEETNECVKGFSKCTNDCEETDNAICFQNTCICAQGFFYESGSCLAELGMSDPHANISSDSDCHIKPGQMIDEHTCVCTNFWFNDELNRECFKTTLQETQTCLENMWCRAMGPYSYCDNDGKCQCHDFASFNESSFYCDKVDDIPEDICLVDSDCDYNEKCIGKYCQCKEGFSLGPNNQCVPDIGSSCLVSSCDHIENSECTNGVCTCGQKFVEENALSCIIPAENIGDSCENDFYCEKIKYAYCDFSQNGATVSTKNDDKSGVCACQESFIQNRGKCWKIKGIGEYCTTRLDCTMVINESVECRKSTCQCPIGQTLTSDNQCSSGSKFKYSYSTLFIVTVIWMFGKF